MSVPGSTQPTVRAHMSMDWTSLIAKHGFTHLAELDLLRVERDELRRQLEWLAEKPIKAKLAEVLG